MSSLRNSGIIIIVLSGKVYRLAQNRSDYNWNFFVNEKKERKNQMSKIVEASIAKT